MPLDSFSHAAAYVMFHSILILCFICSIFVLCRLMQLNNVDLYLKSKENLICQLYHFSLFLIFSVSCETGRSITFPVCVWGGRGECFK